MGKGAQQEGRRLRSLRPWFLVAAMAITWLSGVYGVTAGCGTVIYLRDGRIPDATFALEDARAITDANTAVESFKNGAERRAVAVFGRTMFPLSVARVLISILLVAASAMVLAGRPGSRSFALQVLAANAVFAAIAYATTQELRANWVAATVAAAGELHGAKSPATSSAFWYWRARIELCIFECGVIGFAAIALMSKRTTAFLEAVLQSDHQRQREDEP